METGIEDIFLTYANYRLKDNPQNLHKVFEIAMHHISFEPLVMDRINQTIKNIVILSRCKDFEAASEKCEDLMKQYVGDDRYEDIEAIKRAFRYIYLGSDCDFCKPNGTLRSFLWEDMILIDGIPRCQECDQVLFIHMLNEVVAGKEYSLIADGALMELFSDCLCIFRKEVAVCKTDSEGTFKEILYEKTAFNSLIFTQEYNDVLWLACFSLLEFLLHNDRRKLKKCPFCHEFFVASNISRKRCKSPNCRKEYERLKKQKQRERDLAKYY